LVATLLVSSSVRIPQFATTTALEFACVAPSRKAEQMGCALLAHNAATYFHLTDFLRTIAAWMQTSIEIPRILAWK
jgi:hypothetical protein